MDARHTFPVHADLGARMRSLTMDLQHAKVNLATGKLHAAHYATLARTLEERLLKLEVEAHARVLASSKEARVRSN